MLFFKKNYKRNLFIIAPSDNFNTDIPYLSMPILAGQLKGAGYDVICRDFSNEIFHDFNDKKFIDKILEKNIDFIKRTKKNQNIKLELNYQKYNYIINSIDKKEININFKRQLYDFVRYSYNYGKYNLNYESLKNLCYDENANFFITYFNEKIKKLPKNVNKIFLSMYPGYEIYPILTLARMLKEQYKNAKIILGGYWFVYIKEEIQKHPDFFDLFCDYLIAGEGEISILELMKFLEKEIDISEVSNLMYSSSNKVIINSDKIDIDINKLYYANYDDTDFSKYSQHSTVTMQLSRGCYWGKCKFCTYRNKNNFQLKTISNAINEIKYYVDKYNVKYINFVDDAIHPNYYYRLSQELLKQNIKIKFSSFAIFDNEFNPEVLNKCAEAGLDIITWGLETNSKKVFDIANKSGCFEKRAEIIKNAHNAGIKNCINIIESLPGEQLEDLIQTIKFLYDNVNYIYDFYIQPFQQRVGSEFSLNPQLYGLKNINKEDFSLYYNFKNTNTDINKSNSFFSFMNNYKFSEDSTYTAQEELRILTKEYLKFQAPHLL
ncbi:B12-binding domain-containing radical SAM protein [bacterium]|nr:B12-binding domain-containing radical SAM protein [bacterium]